MALVRGRRLEPVNYWPGFVDALSTMLLVIIFLLSVFMLSQYFLSREVTGKDTALERLNRQIEDLTTLLAMEHSQTGADEQKIDKLTATLDQAKKDKNDLEAAGGAGAGREGQAIVALDAQKQISERALAEVEVLNQQITALRRQLAALQDALSVSQTSERESQEKISDLGSAAQYRAGAKGAGTGALSLGLLRAAAADSGLAARHLGGRRPVRVSILGAV